MRIRVINQSIGFRSHFNIAPGSKNLVIVAHERVIDQKKGFVRSPDRNLFEVRKIRDDPP
jgi:hypothetical protein